LLPALQALVASGQIDVDTGERLMASYRFLRVLENRLQMLRDAQTHRLPEMRWTASASPVAWAMPTGPACWRPGSRCVTGSMASSPRCWRRGVARPHRMR
jgi:Glutamine synthetase adenylyltransferase